MKESCKNYYKNFLNPGNSADVRKAAALSKKLFAVEREINYFYIYYLEVVVKELNAVQMEEINGGDVVCHIVAHIGGELVCGFWCGIGAELLFCAGDVF